MKIRSLAVTAIVGATLAGGYYAIGTQPAPLSVPPSPPTNPPGSPRAVRTQVVGRGTAAVEQTFTGVVRARYESDLAFRVGGKILARLIDIGDAVRAGQPIARLDPADYLLAVRSAEADIAAAEADCKQATAEFDRTERLKAAGAVSSSEFDRIRSERDMAAARRERARRTLDLARNRLGYCTLAADADGQVTALPVEVGQVVADGHLVARVARTGAPEAVVSIPENRVAAVRTGRARASFWALPGVSCQAVLRELSPTADPVTRTYQARFTLADPAPAITLGMTATVHLTPPDAAPGFALPLSALLRRGDQPAVWVVDPSSGRLTLTPVEVAQYTQDTIVLSRGVRPGDLVVTAGVQKLDAGMAVRPWEGGRTQ